MLIAAPSTLTSLTWVGTGAMASPKVGTCLAVGPNHIANISQPLAPSQAMAKTEKRVLDNILYTVHQGLLTLLSSCMAQPRAGFCASQELV